jgi:hypothetical protein
VTEAKSLRQRALRFAIGIVSGNALCKEVRVLHNFAGPLP